MKGHAWRRVISNMIVTEGVSEVVTFGPRFDEESSVTISEEGVLKQG